MEEKKIPLALETAHRELVEVLDEGIALCNTQRYSNSDDVCRCIRRFVGEFCCVRSWADELARRSSFIAVRCKQGATFRNRMDKAFQCCRATPKKPVGLHLSAAKLAIQRLRPQGGLRFEAELSEMVADIKRALHEGVVPEKCRSAFCRWLDEAQQIEQDAKRLEVDGCIYLQGVFRTWDSSATELDASVQAVLETYLGGVHLKSIKAAAELLVDWASNHAPSGPDDVELPPGELAHLVAANPTPNESGKDNDDQAVCRLLSLFTDGMSNERITRAAIVLVDDKMSVNEKLTKIDELLPFPATSSAQQLGRLFGVTKQAVMKTNWWDENRKGEKESEIGRRRAKIRERGKYGDPNRNETQ